MGLLNKINVVSFSTGDVTAAGDYPAAADRVTLPAGALVVDAFIEEETGFADGTNIKLVAGTNDLTGVTTTANIKSGVRMTITDNGAISTPTALKITSTGTHSAGNATIHVAYVNSTK
jgi:hypothetical protein